MLPFISDGLCCPPSSGMSLVYWGHFLAGEQRMEETRGDQRAHRSAMRKAEGNTRTGADDVSTEKNGNTYVHPVMEETVMQKLRSPSANWLVLLNYIFNWNQFSAKMPLAILLCSAWETKKFGSKFIHMRHSCWKNKLIKQKLFFFLQPTVFPFVLLKLSTNTNLLPNVHVILQWAELWPLSWRRSVVLLLCEKKSNLMKLHLASVGLLFSPQQAENGHKCVWMKQSQTVKAGKDCDWLDGSERLLW